MITVKKYKAYFRNKFKIFSSIAKLNKLTSLQKRSELHNYDIVFNY